MDDLFGIIRKVQNNHNQLGSLYLQLTRSLIKLQEIHDSQLVKIEELELEAIQSKVKIEVFKRNELEKSSKISTEVFKPLEKNKSSEESTLITPKRNQETSRNIFPGTFQSFQSQQKKRPDTSVKSKIVKTQSKLHSFIQKKNITEKAEETSQLKDSRIIIDDEGFHMLDYKKAR